MATTHNSLAALFDDIADAMREKFGLSRTMKADDFPQIIRDSVMLPPTFQRCEWIESHGTEFIQTLWSRNSEGWEWYLEFWCPTDPSGNILGNEYGTGSRLCWHADTWLCGSAPGWASYSGTRYGDWNTLYCKFKDKKFSMNGVVTAFRATPSTEPGKPTAIFARSYNSNAYTDFFTGKIRRYISHKDDVKINDFIPCYLKTAWNGIPAGTIGMYDLCGSISNNGTPFYTNEGTGAFTKGPDVT